MEGETVSLYRKPERPSCSKNPPRFLHWHAARCSKGLSLAPIEGLFARVHFTKVTHLYAGNQTSDTDPFRDTLKHVQTIVMLEQVWCAPAVYHYVCVCTPTDTHTPTDPHTHDTAYLFLYCFLLITQNIVAIAHVGACVVMNIHDCRARMPIKT